MSANCETWSSGPAYLSVVNARSCPSTFFFKACSPCQASLVLFTKAGCHIVRSFFDEIVGYHCTFPRDVNHISSDALSESTPVANLDISAKNE